MSEHDPLPSSSTALQRVDQDLEFDTVERFQALEPGYYWTAQKDHERVVAAGETLLLLDLHEFEDRVHSVVLRMHPRDGQGTITMLVADFLDVFILCHDAESIRQREQNEVMQQVADIQADLMRTQSSPQLMYEAVKDRVEAEIKRQEAELERTESRTTDAIRERTQDLRKVHRRAARRSEAKGNPLVAPKIAMASDVGGLIGGGINEAGVQELKRMASQQAVVATAQAEYLKSKTELITQTLKKLAPYLEERSAVALARSSGAVKMAKRIQRGIETLDLYTGRGVEVYDIRSGADAPQDVRLTIVQGKRYAEEELAVWADVDAEFDYTKKERFFDALASDEQLLNQVFPTQRCVISMAMTRRSKDHYKDALTNYISNIQNAYVFLLVRNGGNVHVVYSSSPSHEGAARLFPTKSELERPFMGWDGEKVSIRDIDFGEASKAFENIALVYKRFLVLLCGLDHRLGLMGRFYPAEKRLEFMKAEFQAAHFSFLPDDESGWLIGDQLPPLRAWMEAKNGMLQSGSRVFVLGTKDGAHQSAPELKRRHGLLPTPEQFARPLVAQREGKSLFVSLHARDRYSGDELNAKCYLDGTENSAHDEAWFLCVDAVSLDEVRRYRHSRIYRSMGVAYLRLFRRLEAYLEVEAQEEAESRAYLLRAATEHGGLDASLAASTLGLAVRNWRASRRGAALPNVNAKAELNEVLTLMVPEGRLPGSVQSMVDQYLATSPDTPLLLTRSGKAKLMLYVEANEDDKRPYPNVLTWGWVRRITLEPGKTKLKVAASTLLWLGEQIPASEVEVRRWEALAPWLNAKEEPIPLRRYGAVLPLLDAAKEWEPVLRAGPGSGIEKSLFDRLHSKLLHLNVTSRGKYTIDVTLAIPLAVYSDDGRELKTVYAKAHVETALCTYGDAEQRALVRGRFNRSGHARAKLDAKLVWRFIDTTQTTFLAHDEPTKDGLSRYDYNPKWTQQSIQVNVKRGAHRVSYSRRDAAERGKPMLTSKSVTVSPDRALDQLTGRVPGRFRVDWLSNKAYRLRSENHWAFSTVGSGDRFGQSGADARKVKLDAIRQEKYVHRIKAALSPLVLEPGKERTKANALFKAPLVSLHAGDKKDD